MMTTRTLLLATLAALASACATVNEATGAAEAPAETEAPVSVAPPVCAPVAYSVAHTSPQATSLILEAAAAWNAALGREALVEVAGAPAVSVTGEPCVEEENAWGATDPDGSIVICASRIHGSTPQETADLFRATVEHEFGHRLVGMVHLLDPTALMAADGGGAFAPTPADVAAVTCHADRCSDG